MSKGANRFSEGESNKIVIHLKTNEFYSFAYDRSNQTEILRHTGRCAANSELSFTWHDASVVAEKIRALAVHSGPSIAATVDPLLDEVPRIPESAFEIATKNLIKEIC